MKYTNNTIRINFLFIICIVFLFAIFLYKSFIIATNDEVEGTNIRTLAKNRSTAEKTIVATRGNIYDVEGNLLAQNVNSYTLIAYLAESRTTDEKNPKHVVDKELTAEKLSSVLTPLNKNTTKKYILERLNTEGVYQVEFGSGGKNLSENVKQKIEALALPGIDFIKTTNRYYQNGDFASYIIGYAKKQEDSEEIVGELGIEGYTDRWLQGENGKIIYEQDAYGYQMANSNFYEEPAKDGLDVYLTIDKEIQIFVDNAIEKMNKYKLDKNYWALITIADANTGAILGSASSPSFNPNNLNTITSYENPLTSYVYEPGSTMKIFSFMSAIESGKYNGSNKYKSGKIKVDDFEISDWNRYGWGDITYDVGFTYSSNVAAVKLAQAVGRKDLLNYYQALGFGEQTGIELSNEYSGKVDFYYNSELAASSYGQGMTVTPIQMIQALTSITNDGTILKPYVISKIVNPNTGKVEYEGKKTEIRKVYSTATVNKIIELMDATVNNEDKSVTAYSYQTPSIRLIGKTGTADYIDGTGKYVGDSYHVIRSFAGVFPKDKPKYIIYVAVKNFSGSSADMGAITKDLVESVAKNQKMDTKIVKIDDSKRVTVPSLVNKEVTSVTTNLTKQGLNVITIGDGKKIISQYPKSGTVISNKSKIFLLTSGNNYIMPNIVGWSSSEFIDFCNIIGVQYELEGYGYVISQSLKSGSKINKDEPIKAVLKNQEPLSLVTKEDVKNEKTTSKTN